MPQPAVRDLSTRSGGGAPCLDDDTHVLAAEDHEINRKLLHAILAFIGGGPTVVNNGAEAVLAWELGDWDVILMDIQMPEMDGVSATRLIRAKELESGRTRTPIIAVTCNTSREDVAAYRAAGMDDLVAKPIQSATLLAAMERAVSSAPPRNIVTGYRTLRLEPNAIDDARTLATYISKELKRFGIARSTTYVCPAPPC